MAPDSLQQDLLRTEGRNGVVVINDRCRLQKRQGHVVVSACGVAIASYSCGDRMAEAHAMVSLVNQGWAQQTAVAHAFGCDPRTVRRNQRRFESGGLAALGRAVGYPKGRPRVPRSREEQVHEWKAEGVANHEIARRLGVSTKAVRKLVRRLGWEPTLPEQGALYFGSDPEPRKSSGAATPPNSAAASAPAEGAAVEGDPNLSGSGSRTRLEAPPMQSKSAKSPAEGTPVGGDPNVSGSDRNELLPRSLDTDPTDRSVDRVMACVGLLEDAAPLFGSAASVPGAGVLLAMPVLVQSGIFESAAEVYGSIGPAFYGLRTTVATLLLMALLRIKRPEGLKEHSPQMLGRLLGLDRAPEVKTLRRKLARLASFERAAELGRVIAQRRVASRGHAMGFLYVDGHVRAYHGKRSIPKAHLARMRLSMSATTDYWVNDMEGEPLFVVTAEANQALSQMLPPVLDEVRALVGERRVTAVFDRGGWSPKLFRDLLDRGFDILTYRKKSPGKPLRRLPRSRFEKHEAVFDGRKVRYLLADCGTYLQYGPRHKRRRLHLREVTRLRDGHQTQIVTSRWDLTPIEVAHRMFERWRQENFFKYLREEYALDALVDYGVEPADPTRQVPNPKRKALNAELRAAYAELNSRAVEHGVGAFSDRLTARKTLRCFKKDNAPLTQSIREAMERVAALERKRASMPIRVPVRDVVDGDVIKLRVERKHLADLFKMVAYQTEGDLLRLIAPHYKRAEDEGRTLVQSALACAGDIEVGGGELRVHLEPLSSPHRSHALAALCQALNETRTRYPGSELRLRFDVKPPPQPSMAFPGPTPHGATSPKPDSHLGG